MEKNYEYLCKLQTIYAEYLKFDEEKIPLCAAETYVSPFVKQGLISKYEGKYISGYLGRDKDKDFVGSDFLEKILNLASDLAREIFNSKYNDFRCLTGMNTVALILMSLVDKSSKILITDPSSGGHGSLPKLCDNYGVRYESIPYNYEKMQIDYDRLNEKINNDKDISFLFFCQSDVIQPPELSKIKLKNNIGIIYDATQTLGLIAGKVLQNPLEYHNNVVLIGGTHKTFPSVTCGFVASNNDDYIKKLDQNISPNFLRNIQVNNIVSVCLSMIEILTFGSNYSNAIVNVANQLGKNLTDRNIKVKKINDGFFTLTHQIYIEVSEDTVDEIYTLFKTFGISINKRKTKYVNGFRIGVQEIARYDMSEHVAELSELISMIILNPSRKSEIFRLKYHLSKFKQDRFIIDKIFMELE